jgi:hypothetical protein
MPAVRTSAAARTSVLIGAVMRVDEVRHRVVRAGRGGDLVYGPLDIATEPGRRIEPDDAVAGRQERGLAAPVRDPVEISLDAPDVVALSVDRRAKRGRWDRPTVRAFASPVAFHPHERRTPVRGFESLNALALTTA